MEKATTKSIAKGSARKGWSLAKRIDRIGTELSWTHFTVDWFDKYSDFYEIPKSQSQDIDNLEDFKIAEIFKKYIK